MQKLPPPDIKARLTGLKASAKLAAAAPLPNKGKAKANAKKIVKNLAKSKMAKPTMNEGGWNHDESMAGMAHDSPIHTSKDR